MTCAARNPPNLDCRRAELQPLWRRHARAISRLARRGVFGLSHCLSFCLSIGLLAGLSPGPAAAQVQPLSERQLIELAGQGRYEELAQRLLPGIEKLSVGALHALCYAYSRMKRYRQLLACLDRLEAALEPASRDKATLLFGLDDATPTVHLMRAEAFIDLNQIERAVAAGKRVLEWFDKEGGAGELDIRIDALAALALAAARADDAKTAAEHVREIENIRIRWNTSAAIVTVRSFALARAYLALERYEEACRALDADKNFDLRKSIEETLHFSPPNWVWQQLPRNFMRAKCRYGMGRVAEAKADYEALLRIPSVRQNTGIYWLILFDRGRIAEEEGDLEGAIRFYREAIEIIELLRSSISTEASKIGFVGNKQAVYGALVAALFRRQRPAEALEVVDRAKARALVDLLADRYIAVPAQRFGRDAERVAALLDQHRAAEEALLAQTPGKDEATASNQRKTLAAVSDSMRKVAPELASLIAVAPASATELMRLLDPDEVGIQYFLHGEQLFALTFDRRGSRAFALSGADLISDIRNFRNAVFRRAPRAGELAQKLYARLIAPLEAALGERPLLIVPHSGLHYLPFAALHDGKRYLVEKHALRVMTSAGALQFLHRPPAGTRATALIFGNPTLDLPSAGEEALKLGKLLPGARVLIGQDATKQAFLEAGPRFRTIHIAGHGIFDPNRPLDSKLLFAKTGPAGGELTVSELYAQTLNADLVTLSACETGLGRITDGGDVIGLTRGFLYAGASTVVASLWEVADEATLELMQRFYRNLARMNKRDALRTAQIETARTSPQPFFWAAFYLTGSAR